MRAHHARRRHRLACLSFVLAGCLVGCDGKSKVSGVDTSNDPRAGTRRKEMSEFMKNQASGGPAAANRNSP